MVETAGLGGKQEAEIDLVVSKRKHPSRRKEEEEKELESSGSKTSSRSPSEDESPTVDTISTTSAERSSSPPAKNFFKLPPPPPAAFPVNCTKGWPTYLTSRWSGDRSIVDRVTADPCILAGLTYPITIAYLLACLKFSAALELTVVVLGAMWPLEERLLRETGYWGEIAVCLRCRIHVVLCGREVSETKMSGGACELNGPNADTRCSLFRGSFTQLQNQFPGMLAAKSTMLVAYNSGFGNFRQPQGAALLYSWLEDLQAVVSSRLPALFTQANTEAELSGEVAFMAHVLGARFLVLPTQNPFLAIAPKGEGEGEGAASGSSCANHSFYAVQGCDPLRESCKGMDVSTPRGRNAVLAAAHRAMQLDSSISKLEQMTTTLESGSESGMGPVATPAVTPTSSSGEGLEWTATRVLYRATTRMAPGPRPCKLQRQGPPENELSVPNYRLEAKPELGVLHATVSLPLLESARDVDLEVYEGELIVSVDNVYEELRILLPSPIDESKVAATFNRRLRELEVQLTTQPTPRAPPRENCRSSVLSLPVRVPPTSRVRQ